MSLDSGCVVGWFFRAAAVLVALARPTSVA